MVRKKLPDKITEEVLVQSRRRCCLCYGLNRDINIKRGQIAHLDQKNNNNELNNLVFLCFDHHDQFDGKTSQSKGLTAGEVRRFKKDLHDVIEKEWNKPVEINDKPFESNLKTGISGHYVRDGKIESAELEVTELLNGNIRVTGLALWGKQNELGPNLGELDFEVTANNRKATFVDSSLNEEYKIELVFNDTGLVANESCVVAYFGMNVSFEGVYKKIG